MNILNRFLLAVLVCVLGIRFGFEVSSSKDATILPSHCHQKS